MLTRSATDLGSGPLPNDFIVKEDGREIGRILLTNAADRQTPWFWTITAQAPQRLTDRGYEAALERALKAFKDAWERKSQQAR